MKCEKHPSIEAVAQCEKCGAGICADCVENTKELKEDFGTMCLGCYEETVKSISSFHASKFNEISNAIKGKIIFYVLGLACIALDLFYLKAYVCMVLGVFLCGIYTGIAGWKAGKEANKDEYPLMAQVILFLICVPFGIIATPISLLSDFAKKKEAINYYSIAENELERISTIE